MSKKQNIPAAGAPAAPAGHDPSGNTQSKDSVSAEEPAADVPTRAKLRAVFYIDGFNLYHAIDGIGEPHLKWLNLWDLASALIDHSKEVLHGVIWCTAEFTRDKDKLARHRAYRDALESVGVRSVLGHFIEANFNCPTCGPFTKPTEKAGDVNVAIHAVADALTGGVDTVYLLTADSDQVATAKFLREICPEIGLVIVAPPSIHSQHLLSFATGSRTIEEVLLRKCLFPKVVQKDGQRVTARPVRYDPPYEAGKGRDITSKRGKRVEVVMKKSRKPKLQK